MSSGGNAVGTFTWTPAAKDTGTYAVSFMAGNQLVGTAGTVGAGITIGAVGSRRYRVTFTGPGGHSYGAFGLVNPAFAMADAIERLAAIKVPDSPKTTFNVGVVGGGTSINSVDERGTSLLMWASASGKLDIMRYLIEQGADPNIGRTSDQSPALIFAVYFGQAEAVQLLIDSGATDNSR